MKYTFKEWKDETGAIVGTTPAISLFIDRDKILTAYYEEVPPVQHTLSIRSTTGGTTNPIPGDYIYDEGTVVRVTAVPDTGYQLDHWLFDGESIGKADVVDITMNANHTLQAVFVVIPPPPECTLSIVTTTGGTTNPAPGTYMYPENTTVQVTAIPDEGYNFNHWILDGVEYTTNPVTIVMDADHTLTAYFSEIPPPPPEAYNLTIVVTTGGTTEPVPGVYETTAGDVITVTAIPDEGYKFKRFELDGEVKLQNPINVGMDADHVLLAVFEVTVPPIKMSTIGIGMIAAIGAGTAGYAITRRKK